MYKKEPGDYQYIIFDVNNNVDTVYNIVENEGGSIKITDMNGYSYTLSSTQYKKYVYIGLHNKYKK